MTSTSRIHLLARAGLLAIGSLGIAGCEDGIQLPFGQVAARGDTETAGTAGSAPMVGRDVEAPEVFLAEEQGLWDGRPSLGGVWVAHPDATDPERVLIRNPANGDSVVGALFRREREMPGPALQVSSDAAAALNVIAGQPTELHVVALRTREEPEPLDIPVAPPEAVAAEGGTAAGAVPGAIAATALDPIASAEAAIEAAETAEVTPAAAPAASASIDVAEIRADTAVPHAVEVAAAPVATEPAPVATPIAAPPAAAPAAAAADAGGLDRPYVQIGIFSVEENAEETAEMLRTAGVIPTVLDQTSSGSQFWRVIVGPARTDADRTALLETVQGLGFGDAYYVTN